MPREDLNSSLYEQIKGLDTKINSVTPSLPSAGWDTAIVQRLCISKDQYPNKGVGQIQVRRLGKDKGIPLDELPWAKPFNTTYEIPLVGEYVLVMRAPSFASKNGSKSTEDVPVYYYMGPINYSENINSNSSIIQIGSEDMAAAEQGTEDLEEDSNVVVSEDVTAPENYNGKVFIGSQDIFPLQPLEGDNLIQGRWGNSIRLGCSQVNPDNDPDLDASTGFLGAPWGDNEDSISMEDPILIIRNGQGGELTGEDITTQESPTTVFESLKTDASSIWLTDGQTINSLKEIFEDTGEEGTGVSTTSNLKNNGLDNLLEGPSAWGNATPSAIIASDRIIFVAKDDEVLLFGKNGIGLCADGNITIESADEITLEAPTIRFKGDVRFGDNNGMDGEKLLELLEELIDEISGLTVITPVGPGTVAPNIALQTIKDKLETCLTTGEA